jgi:organic radical activating enzyme
MAASKAEQLGALLAKYQADYAGAVAKAVWHPANFGDALLDNPAAMRPVTVEFFVTTRCNHRCPGCTFAQNGLMSGSGRDMSWETFEACLRALQGNGRTRTIVFTGGEPLAHPRLPSMMAAARAAGIEVGLFTNGTLMAPALAWDLLSCSPQFIRVSINAGSRARYAVQHGADRFDKALEALRLLAEAKRAQRVATEIGAGFLVTARTSDEELRDVGQLLERLFKEETIEYAMVRPEIDYFAQHVPDDAPAWRGLPARLERFLPRAPRLAVNWAAFEALALACEGRHRAGTGQSPPLVAPAWHNSVTPAGDLYLNCENTGMPDFCAGSLAAQGDAVFGSPRHLALLAALRAGTVPKQNLPSFQTRVLNKFLCEARALSLSREDLASFYEAVLPRLSPAAPRHVNCL